MWVIFGFTVFCFLGLAVGQQLQTSQIQGNTNDIKVIQERTTLQVLCPLYGLLLHAVRNPVPDRVDTPHEVSENTRQVIIIQAGFDRLGCPAPVRP